MKSKLNLKLIYLFLLVPTLLLSSCQQQIALNGEIVKVKDGDSFIMMIDGNSVEVRLQGIDCPEKNQPFSSEAKKFTSEITKGKKLQLEKHGTDKYKRTLGVVIFEDGSTLNEELLKAGLAWHFKKYSDDSNYAELESSAKEERLGLWIDNNPVPPWEYRSNKRKAKKK